MPSIIRLKQNGTYVYPQTTFGAVLSEQGTPMTEYLTEYNVSLHHINTRTGDNTFTLEEAIEAVPEQYRNPRMKLIFIDASSGDYTSFICGAIEYSEDIDDWRGSVEDGAVATEDSDGLMSAEDKTKLDGTPDTFTEITNSDIDNITH